MSVEKDEHVVGTTQQCHVNKKSNPQVNSSPSLSQDKNTEQRLLREMHRFVSTSVCDGILEAGCVLRGDAAIHKDHQKDDHLWDSVISEI